ncbi:unnamed protein product [Fraxinus pennsylvanica]|uniref:Homeobox-leucine zipper protein n=1 Tax=Fraxinus pennsylvanica TaxID=56036 RepID=A0AAD2DX37_9LAMI|nr:unnamed protein product [Fraxinus pennsylvanica]
MFARRFMGRRMNCLMMAELGEKKRKLNMEQVKTLEKSFESSNKLEPERKVKLSQAHMLQPRQIAIWFHNNRARWIKRSSISFLGIDNVCEEVHGSKDDCLMMAELGEKKRKLNMEQVKTLEKSFESSNRLEPERKVKLSQAHMLQPRQIAIWFQNNRARCKIKQLEKDYQFLKRQFEVVKAEMTLFKYRTGNSRPR